MINNTMIRTEIESYMSSQGLTMQGFSKISGINRGTLSAIINRNPPRKISVRELDLITCAMGLPEGAFYPMYAEECFIQAEPHWRRLRPFLLRCAALNKLECIEKILGRLAEDLAHIAGVFDTAERLFEQGHRHAAAILYKCVIESERYNYTERLAISRYRLFKLDIGQDTEANLWAVFEFEPFLSWLPRDCQLDALYEMIKIYFSVRKWERLEKAADNLINQTEIVHKTLLHYGKQSSPSKGEPLKLQRSLVYYYGQACFAKAVALQKQGDYEQSRVYTCRNMDLGWLQLPGSEDAAEIRKYNLWAQAYSCTLDILMGRIEGLDTFIQFLLKATPLGKLTGLVAIIESANKYGFCADAVLDRFYGEIADFNNYNDIVSIELRLRFFLQLSIYCFNRDRVAEGIKYCLKSIDLSVTVNNESTFAEGAALFELYRNYGL